MPRATQRQQRRLGITLGQGHRSPGVRGHRIERLAALALGDLLELAAGAARHLDFACGQHDLHVSGQQGGTLQRLGGLAHRATDRGGCRPTLALREPQQRKARLRFAPLPTRLPICRLGRAELAPQPINLPLAVEGLADRELIQHARCEALAWPVALPSGRPPRPPVAA